MEVAREEVDNQQAVPIAEAHVHAPEIDDSAERAAHDSGECVGVALNPFANREHVGERILDKGKEKVDEKMKEPLFIGGVSLVNLDDCDVTDNKLL